MLEQSVVMQWTMLVQHLGEELESTCSHSFHWDSLDSSRKFLKILSQVPITPQ